MARARNIKPGFFRNADLVELSFETRLLFIGLWTIADRAGRLEDKPKQIKMEVFPADSVDCNACLDELAACGLVERYEYDGKRYLQVVNFCKHQNPHRDEKASTIPDRNGNCATHKLEQKKHSANTVQAQCKEGANTVAIGLIPDSLNLIPEEVHPPSLRDGPPSEPEKQKKSVTLAQWMLAVKASGEKLISDYEPLWAYCEKVGIPADWIEIAWIQFRERYTTDEKCKRKRYADWRRVFKRAIEENWLKLWFFSEGDRQFRLTTVGVSADLATREAA